MIRLIYVNGNNYEITMDTIADVCTLLQHGYTLHARSTARWGRTVTAAELIHLDELVRACPTYSHHRQILFDAPYLVEGDDLVGVLYAPSDDDPGTGLGRYSLGLHWDNGPGSEKPLPPGALRLLTLAQQTPPPPHRRSPHTHPSDQPALWEARP